MNTKLQDAVLEILTKAPKFERKSGETIQGLTQTDLIAALREQGWRIPPSGFFWSEMTNLGFRALQPYKDGELRQVFRDGRRGRRLGPYNVVYTV